MEEQTSKKVVYVCEGECGAKLTEEEYKAHPKKVCRAEVCSRKGVPFSKKEELKGCLD